MKSRIALVIVVALTVAGCTSPTSEKGVAIKPLLEEAKSLGVHLEREVLLPEKGSAAELVEKANRVKLTGPAIKIEEAYRLIEAENYAAVERMLVPYKEIIEIMTEASKRTNLRPAIVQRDDLIALMTSSRLEVAQGHLELAAERLAVVDRLFKLKAQYADVGGYLGISAEIQIFQDITAKCLVVAERKHRAGAKLAAKIRFEPIQVDWRATVDRDINRYWVALASDANRDTHIPPENSEAAHLLKSQLEFLRQTKGKSLSDDEQAALFDKLIMPDEPIYGPLLDSIRRMQARTELVNTLIDLILHREQTGAWPKALSELKTPVPSIRDFSYKVEGKRVSLWWKGDPVHSKDGLADEVPAMAIRFP